MKLDDIAFAVEPGFLPFGKSEIAGVETKELSFFRSQSARTAKFRPYRTCDARTFGMSRRYRKHRFPGFDIPHVVVRNRFRTFFVWEFFHPTEIAVE